jgi:hypothetical protein
VTDRGIVIMQCRLTLCAVLALATTPTLAQDAPNLVGKWSGEAQAVIIGPNPYRVPDGSGPSFPEAKITFTYEITEQHDTRFAGTMSGGKFSEAFIGALKPPAYDAGVMVDVDGQYAFTLRDANTLDVCYTHVYPNSRAASCWTMTKQN